MDANDLKRNKTQIKIFTSRKLHFTSIRENLCRENFPLYGKCFYTSLQVFIGANFTSAVSIRLHYFFKYIAYSLGTIEAYTLGTFLPYWICAFIHGGERIMLILFLLPVLKFHLSWHKMYSKGKERVAIFLVSE